MIRILLALVLAIGAAGGVVACGGGGGQPGQSPGLGY